MAGSSDPTAPVEAAALDAVPVDAVPVDAVAACSGDSYWWVAGCGWGDDRPLAAEYADLLAPPVVVGAATVPPGRRAAAPTPNSVDVLIFAAPPRRNAGRHRSRSGRG
ncbi:MAG TPA: hypothetical protein VES42_21435 [Pilimelia sp.]|nr:hypothetical protein [Pilimelia sp.]